MTWFQFKKKIGAVSLTAAAASATNGRPPQGGVSRCSPREVLSSSQSSPPHTLSATPVCDKFVAASTVRDPRKDALYLYIIIITIRVYDIYTHRRFIF